MNKTLWLISTFLLYFCITGHEGIPDNAVEYVDPFIGTGKYLGPSKWGREGGTYPGAVVPWGMVQASPETRLDTYPKGYYFEDDQICFFSFCYHLSGYPGGSSGLLRMIPVNGWPDFSANQYGSIFSHEKEEAVPGYYRVFLDDYGIDVELTATVHAAFARIAFGSPGRNGIMLFDAQDLEADGKRRLRGRWGPVYCIIESDTDYANMMKTEQGYFVEYAGSATQPFQVLLKMAFSGVDAQGAERNLNAEIKHWDFTKTRQEAREAWEKQLNRIEISGGTKEQRKIFYTALYHSMLLPFINSDVDGRYRGMDYKIYSLAGETNYSVFSPWDTFRTLHPLLTLLAPSVQRDMVRSLLRIYDQTGRLPSRPMTGNHAIPIIVDSYFKGIRDFDVQKAYEAMRKSLLGTSGMRRDMREYIEQGYVPAEIPESVTRTLEYAYNDWVLARMSNHLDRKDDYDRLIERAFNYRYIFNPAERFMMPRNRDGSREELGGFREGDKWTYTWFVPHNIRDLINLMGGNEAFAGHLERAFTGGHYIHDNEPPLHYAWLFNYAGKPWKTQYWVREIMEKYYTAAADGIPGNDDHGSMSSWYVFGAMGLYPVCPGEPAYAIGSPLFDKVTVRQENGRTLEITAPRTSRGNIYIQSAAWNGNAYDKSWISHADLLNGGILALEMGADPQENRAADTMSSPPSETAAFPDFSISGFRLSDTLAHAHQPLYAYVFVSNSGSTGTYEVRLYLDDVYARSEWLMLNPGEDSTVSMPFRLYVPGSYTVRVNALEAGTVRISPDPSIRAGSYIVDDLQVGPLLKHGESAEIGFQVKNITAFPDTARVTVMLDGAVFGRVSVFLNPGERKPVRYVPGPLTSGMHTISLPGLPSRNVKVYRNPAESIVLDLQFDEGRGKLAGDRSGFGNDCRLMGETKWVGGKSGKAIQTGLEGYAEIPLSPSLTVPGDSFTMMLWFYPVDEAGREGRYQRYADFFTQGDHHVLKMQRSDLISFIAGGWGRGQCIAVVPDNWNRNWHHVAGVCDGRELRLYIDGNLADKQTVVGEANPGVFPWNLGRNAEFTWGRSTNGRIDDVRIYREPLSQEEIRRIMNR